MLRSGSLAEGVAGGILGRAAGLNLRIYDPDCTFRVTMRQLPPAVRPIERVGFLLIPGFALMSYACASEPFRAANQLSGRTLYHWWHASPGDKPAIASNGAAVVPDVKFGADPDSLDF